jgi:hypothetical protein
MTQPWEFVTTLDYEWSVFYGRRPYRWTIWVCDFFCISSPTPGPLRLICALVDLLLHACGDPRSRNTRHRLF